MANGLADGLGGLDYVARDVIKAEQIVDFTSEDSFSETLARRLGTTAADSFWNKILSGAIAGGPTVR